MLNKHTRWFHSQRVKFSFVKMSASWFFVSMYLIWIIGSKIDSIKQPIKSNSVGSGNMSHGRTSAFNDHLHCPGTNTIKLLDARIGHLKEQYQCLSSHRFCCEICFYHSQVAPFDLKHGKHFQEQKQLDPIVPEQANHPVSVPCPERWSQILLSSENQQFVSCTSTNLLEQMYDFQKRIMFLQKWISNLEDLPRSQSPETVPICIA